MSVYLLLFGCSGSLCNQHICVLMWRRTELAHSYSQWSIFCELTLKLDAIQMAQDGCKSQWPWCMSTLPLQPRVEAVSKTRPTWAGLILNWFAAFVLALYENANERKIGRRQISFWLPDCNSLNKAQIHFISWACVYACVCGCAHVRVCDGQCGCLQSLQLEWNLLRSSRDFMIISLLIVTQGASWLTAPHSGQLGTRDRSGNCPLNSVSRATLIT